jgi:hypothetical protein
LLAYADDAAEVGFDEVDRGQVVPADSGLLQRFLGGRFGQAIVTGAGIGIGDDIVNSIFDRL